MAQKQDSLAISFFADSHVGLVREDNEDSFGYCYDHELGIGFALVADGVGGHDRGEVASQLTVKLYIQAWRAFVDEGDYSVAAGERFLAENITQINGAVFRLNEALGNSMPMGTTVIAMVFVEDTAIIGHVGDSRAYVFRKGAVTQLTRDHSYVEELLKNKMITEKEAENHPLGHIITRSVGPLDTVMMDVQSFECKRGDRFVMCSDGLTNHVSNQEMVDMVFSSDTPRTAVKKLLVGSLHRGGEDNVTVLGCYL